MSVEFEAGTPMSVVRDGVASEVRSLAQRSGDAAREISSASAEQSSGVSQIGQAATLMDRATQQNAALVEQSAAESLQQQARQLVQAMSAFKLAPC